jgi:hypothetical protein
VRIQIQNIRAPSNSFASNTFQRSVFLIFYLRFRIQLIAAFGNQFGQVIFESAFSLWKMIETPAVHPEDGFVIKIVKCKCLLDFLFKLFTVMIIRCVSCKSLRGRR